MGEKLQKTQRILLILGCIFVMLLGILLLFYLWSAVAISGTCGFMEKIKEEDRVVLNEIDASEEFTAILNRCLYSADNSITSESERKMN